MTKKQVDPHEVTTAESIRPGVMRAGRSIGGYELRDVLGEGGMGLVWRAHDPDLDRELAIKVLKRHDAAPSLRKRLLREARAMARLKHPNVLTVYEVGTEDDRDFIAMELVEGGSLDAWLATHPPRTEIYEAMLAAGRGLAAAHGAGLVHRDFKPHNILRRHDGRVLLTDFGLARGVGDDAATASEATDDHDRPVAIATTADALDATHDSSTPDPTPRPTPMPGARTTRNAAHTDSLLDSPLTQTGALIGTPAYMAPEQFLGNAPDPRTDQFAFCVSAWQALTGGRPYTGATIDELRAAAIAGITNVPSDLPPAVRAVLARGLHPDPATRWPDLEALLDALVAAITPRRSRRRLAILAGGATVGIAAVAFVAVAVARRGGSTLSAAVCEPAEVAFALAWPTAARDELQRELAARGVELSTDRLDDIATPLDAFRDRWTASYGRACADPKAKQFHARVGCLLGVRDQIAPLVHILRTADAPLLALWDSHGMIPNLAGCEGDSPVAPPLIPDDKRTRIVAALAATITLRMHRNLAQAIDRLLAEATDIGWQPLHAVLLTIGGNEYLRRDDPANARELFERALPEASEAHDLHMQAISRLGLLDASVRTLADPGTDAPAGALHDELTRALVYARSAIRAAGSDPILAGALATTEAQAQIGLAQWGRYPKAYDEALALMTKAKQLFEGAGDIRRASSTAAEIAQLHLDRGRPTAIDDATYVARAAADTLDAAKLPPSPFLEEVRAELSLLRGDYRDAQQRFAQLAQPPAFEDASERTGLVAYPDGRPVPGARVVAARGELLGDPTSSFTDPRQLDGTWVETGADGRFKLDARPGDFLFAELGGRRSLAHRAPDEPLTIFLAPTEPRSGTVRPKGLVRVFGLVYSTAFGRNWQIRIALRDDQRFHLDHAPRHTDLGATGPVGHATRRLRSPTGATEVTWPLGQAIEVIVRSAGLERGAQAWVFRGRVQPTTRRELSRLADDAADVAWATLVPIGADNTDAGRAHYARGDRHAVITGNPDGETTACIVKRAGDDAPARCQTVVIQQAIPRADDDPPGPVGVTPLVFD